MQSGFCENSRARKIPRGSLGGSQAQKETCQQEKDEDFGQHPGLRLRHQHELPGDKGHSFDKSMAKI